MTSRVSLHAVVEEWELLCEGRHVFLNRLTGELFGGPDELLSVAEEGDDAGLHDWEAEIVTQFREIINSPDWLALPRRASHEDYEIMERFCLERCEGRLQEKLLAAISGRSAFRRFKDALLRSGIKEAWYAFRREAFAEDAARWLEAQGIPYRS